EVISEMLVAFEAQGEGLVCTVRTQNWDAKFVSDQRSGARRHRVSAVHDQTRTVNRLAAGMQVHEQLLQIGAESGEDMRVEAVDLLNRVFDRIDDRDDPLTGAHET